MPRSKPELQENPPRINYQGLDIEIGRKGQASSSGCLNLEDKTCPLYIDIETSDLDPADVFENGVPRIVIYLNEERLETTPDGGWRIGHATSHDDDGDVHIVPARSSFIPPSEQPEPEYDD